MLMRPIRHTPITSMEELLEFSYRTERKAKPMTRCQNNGQIAFTDKNGCVYITPYRPEIHEILENNGQAEGDIFVPFSNGEPVPYAYEWLKQIAEEENWAMTHKEAYNISIKKGIKEVKILQKVQIQEIIYSYNDEESNTEYLALTDIFLHNDSQKNIGTYIIIDRKSIIVCDEYGRTFLIKAKTVINDIVNNLINAGYKRTEHPEYYIK